jgi:hypothetical protein
MRYYTMMDAYSKLPAEEKLKISFNAWLEDYHQEHGPPKAKKRAYVVKDKKYLKPERSDVPEAVVMPKVIAPKKPRKKMTALEARRRKIELDLQKVEERRAAWRKDNGVELEN